MGMHYWKLKVEAKSLKMEGRVIVIDRYKGSQKGRRELFTCAKSNIYNNKSVYGL